MPVRLGRNILPPQKVKDVQHVYPAEAQRTGTQGVVIIEATICSMRFFLREEALAAARAWRPATLRRVSKLTGLGYWLLTSRQR
jgi:hypothetical protein